jgi:hypothetical protein
VTGLLPKVPGRFGGNEYPELQLQERINRVSAKKLTWLNKPEPASGTTAKPF